MLVLYLDYLPVMLFGLAGWVISQWAGTVVPDLPGLARAGALLVFLGGFYKATTILLLRGYGLTIDIAGHSQFFFLFLSLCYYDLALCIYSLRRFLSEGEYSYPSRNLTLVFPLLFLAGLGLLWSRLPEENYWGPALISAMTLSNVVFVVLACRLALFLKDRLSAMLIVAGILLNFSMAALLVLMPLENDFANAYYPNLMREIIFNSLAQGALLWAVLRIRERLYDCAASTRESGSIRSDVAAGL